ncbi:MAG: hypothetical protein JWQ78_938, partial [Sediminibacterium sp.]|nr:hypothetical protein [Sediminibacterium sp.]
AVYWILGALWYSPLLFAKSWVKMVNLKMDDPDAKKGMPLLFIGSFVLMLVASIGLGTLSRLIYIPDAMHAAKLGLLVSVCFSFTASSISYLYTRKPAGLYAIDGGYHVIGTVLAAVVIHLLS